MYSSVYESLADAPAVDAAPLGAHAAAHVLGALINLLAPLNVPFRRGSRQAVPWGAAAAAAAAARMTHARAMVLERASPLELLCSQAETFSLFAQWLLAARLGAMHAVRLGGLRGAPVAADGAAAASRRYALLAPLSWPPLSSSLAVLHLLRAAAPCASLPLLHQLTTAGRRATSGATCCRRSALPKRKSPSARSRRRRAGGRRRRREVAAAPG